MKDATKALAEDTSSTTTSNEVALAKSAGDNMFWRVQKWGGGNRNWVPAWLEDSYTSHFHIRQFYKDTGNNNAKAQVGFQLDPTGSFREQCKTDRIIGVTATATWTCVYKGNTNSSAQASYLAQPNTFELDEVVFELTSSTDMNKGDIASGGDSVKFDFVFEGDNFYKIPDKTNTSIYDTTFTVTFTLKTATTSTPATQYLEAIQNGKHYNQTFEVRDSYKFYPQRTSKS